MNKAFHTIWVQKRPRDRQRSLLRAGCSQVGTSKRRSSLCSTEPAPAAAGTRALGAGIPQTQPERLHWHYQPSPGQDPPTARPPLSLHCMHTHWNQTSQQGGCYSPEFANEQQGQCWNVEITHWNLFLAEETVCPLHWGHCPSITAKGEGWWTEDAAQLSHE